MFQIYAIYNLHALVKLICNRLPIFLKKCLFFFTVKSTNYASNNIRNYISLNIMAIKEFPLMPSTTLSF